MQGGAGELAFLGTGVMISTGSPSQEYLSIMDENGQVRAQQSEGRGSRQEGGSPQLHFGVLEQGGVTFNGAGYTHWESSPIFDLACYGAAYMTGEYITVDCTSTPIT
jgi:hypothetical protein